MFEAASHAALHPGRAARILRNGTVIGHLGELHPRWVQQYELGAAPVVFELELPALLARPFPVFEEVSRYPAVVRDLALVVAENLTWAALETTLRTAAPAIVKNVKLFDQYQGKGVVEGRKSLALRVVMQDTQRTLEDAEVDAAIAQLVAAAEKNLGAELRR